MSPSMIATLNPPRITLASLVLGPLLLFTFAMGEVVAAPATPNFPVLLDETTDTSSPRSTLTGFMNVMKRRYEASLGPDSLLTRYLQSTQLFPDHWVASYVQKELANDRLLSSKFYDLRNIPSAIADQAAWRLTVQLIEILARTPLPRVEDMPDAKDMEKFTYKKWTIPGTEIRIARVEDGPRSGEYLFTPETLAHIPERFEHIKGEPLLTQDYGTMYTFVYDSPSGLAFALRNIFPPRWLLAMPDWMKIHLFAEPLWRWVALILLFTLSMKIIWWSHRLSEAFPKNRTVLKSLSFKLIPTIVVIGLIPPVIFIIGEVLRVSPQLYGYMSLTLWGCFYLVLTWLVWDIGSLFAEWIISMERIRVDSTDSQLIRIAARIIAGGFSLGVLVEGANRIGLPSYSIFAGLGVGGIAFALAGQQTLGNLLGSLIIMFEKPFRIGHSIQTGSLSGTVEQIGFRTALLRTTEGDVLYVPSSELIRHSIENKTLRDHWRIRRSLFLALDTPMMKLNAIKDQILSILLDDLDINTESIRVTLIGIEPRGYNLQIDFIIPTSREEKQLIVTERILTQIIRISEDLGVSFASDKGL